MILEMTGALGLKMQKVSGNHGKNEVDKRMSLIAIKISGDKRWKVK